MIKNGLSDAEKSKHEKLLKIKNEIDLYTKILSNLNWDLGCLDNRSIDKGYFGSLNKIEVGDKVKISINTFEKAEKLSKLLIIEKKEVTDKLEYLTNEYRETLKK